MNQDASGRDPQRLTEIRRQARVLTCGVLGMRGDADLSRIVEQTAAEAGFPFAAVSIVDKSRLWLAAAYGFDPREFTRPNSFCDAAIQVRNFAPLCVPDAWREPRFSFAPAVIEMNVRAYYAAPLLTSDSFALGTLCLFDQKPRTINPAALKRLASRASEATAVIERKPNAMAYAQSAMDELCIRIRFAIADQDEPQITLLDEALRRLEAEAKPNWQ